MRIKCPQKQFRSTLKNWGIKDYFRQLSIVIAGIVITFWVSGAISEHSKQREVEQITGMVREELNDNLESLRFLQSRLEREHRLFSLIRDHIGDFSKLPQDTLEKYTAVPGNDYTHLFKTQSFDVLKNSGIIPHIKDKLFLRSLFTCYNSLEAAQGWINGYYENKTETTEKWLSSIDLENDRKLYSDEEIPIHLNYYWKAILENNSTRNFYLNAPGYLETVLHYCRTTEEQLRKTLENFNGPE